jgi:hypothetical protein
VAAGHTEEDIMKRTEWLAAGFGVFALACSGAAPTAPAPIGAGPTSFLADSAGLQKSGISGTMALVALGPPERRIVTPAGMIHLWEMPEYSVFAGDIAGPVTFHASASRTSDGTHLICRGPFDGEVTFQGRTGRLAGQWTTNCKWDPALGRVSCGGTMNARGEGLLDGVQFHIQWGPGWWPFSYTGTAFSKE